jgi:CO dehydrogenase/acetyl-CoA synthase beta subunit
MSTVIEFLEKLGADAHLRQATRDEVALALADARVDASASEVILAGDIEALYALLEQAPMCCVQTVPHKEDEDEEEEDDEEAPAPDKKAVPRQRVAEPA